MRTVGKVLSSSLETRDVSRKIADGEVLPAQPRTSDCALRGTAFKGGEYESSSILFAVETRAYTLIARDEGPDFAIEPALGLNVAY